MADSHLPEDEATLYVLGELPAARCAEFEARMAGSAELRHLVRELEAGTVALSIGSPQRRPPAQVWADIEKVVSRDSRRAIPSTTSGIAWWRNGWAVAVASVVGWVLYAVFVNSHQAPPAAPHETTVATDPAVTENVASKPPLPATSNANVQLLHVRTEENTALRLKIAELEKETGQLSQLIVQQRTLLSESNRIKFYHLSPVSNTGTDTVAAQLSPALQRAVFMSVGRELGWLPAASKSRVGTAAGSHAAVNTIDGVDFVDLRPTKNEVGNQSPTPQTQSASAQPTPGQPDTESQPADLASAIPAFVSGDKLMVALDPSIVPASSSLTVASYGGVLGTAEGSFMMGNNPVVVTIPYSSGVSFGGGVYLTIGTVTTGGLSNSTQFFVPANP